mgnify:FL=1
MSEKALLLIDLQKESGFGIKGMDEVIANAKLLIEACRERGIPIIYTRQINRSDRIGLSNGEPIDDGGQPIYYNDSTSAIDIFDEIKPEAEDIVIDKYRWSGFFETHLESTLKSLGVKNVLIGGVVTDGCLMTTVFDGYFRDYQMNIVKDLCAATNEGAHMSSLLIMANWIYDLRVLRTAEAIRYVQGDPFKAWTPSQPDSLPFTPETMREQFEKLNG